MTADYATWGLIGILIVFFIANIIFGYTSHRSYRRYLKYLHDKNDKKEVE